MLTIALHTFYFVGGITATALATSYEAAYNTLRDADFPMSQIESTSTVDKFLALTDETHIDGDLTVHSTKGMTFEGTDALSLCSACEKVLVAYYDPYGAATLVLCEKCNDGVATAGPILYAE